MKKILWTVVLLASTAAAQNYSRSQALQAYIDLGKLRNDMVRIKLDFSDIRSDLMAGNIRPADYRSQCNLYNYQMVSFWTKIQPVVKKIFDESDADTANDFALNVQAMASSVMDLQSAYGTLFTIVCDAEKPQDFISPLFKLADISVANAEAVYSIVSRRLSDSL